VTRVAAQARLTRGVARRAVGDLTARSATSMPGARFRDGQAMLPVKVEEERAEALAARATGGALRARSAQLELERRLLRRDERLAAAGSSSIPEEGGEPGAGARASCAAGARRRAHSRCSGGRSSRHDPGPVLPAWPCADRRAQRLQRLAMTMS
jgi:hypothetical protein